MAHPKYWEQEVIAESIEKIGIQEQGKQKINYFSGSGAQNLDPPPISTHHTNVLQKLATNLPTFPPQDWYIVQRTVDRNMSRHPSVTFRILGWLCLFAQKWLDIIRIMKYKKGVSHCYHPHIFCTCAITFLRESCKNDKPFQINISLQRSKNKFIQSENKFIQVSQDMQQLLCNVGLKIACILCADKNHPPSLPVAFGNYSVSKIFLMIISATFFMADK